MSKWSDDEVSIDDINRSNRWKLLIGVIIDQQFDGWYDPCGKSGDDLNPRMTRKACAAMERLKRLLWHGDQADSCVLDQLVQPLEVPTPEQEQIRGAAAIAANALYFADSSDYWSALYRVTRTLSREAWKKIDDGTYRPEMLGNEPLE